MKQWLYEIRKEKDLTMLAVATRSDISESYYSMIENGHRGVSVDTAKKIAEVLGFNWTRFYDTEPEDKKMI